MLRLDGHVHVPDLAAPLPDRLAAGLAEAGFDGAVLISAPPPCFFVDGTAAQAAAGTGADRLANVLAWTRGRPALHPFLWIDPVADGAAEEVARAARAGIAGFKAICSRHEPGDPRAMPVYEAVAASGRPLLFHSGILWDGQPSSEHNRPAAFEALLPVKGLRFALAHASWPWVDECLAVFGKFLNARTARPDGAAEMFLDVTPGTPRIYREALYRKLLGIGYDLGGSLLFGSDGDAADYGAAWTREWAERDEALVRALAPQDADALVADLFGGALLRFLDPAAAPPRTARPLPVPGR